MGRRMILWVAVVATAGAAPAAAADPDPEKLFARCVDAAALVYGPADAKEPTPRAGALVLDPGKRLLLAPSTGVPDAPTVLFPAHTAKGELRNTPADYADLWKRGERWAGKVLHRDSRRDLAVIELDRAPPERTRAAEFAGQTVRLGATVRALAGLSRDRSVVWEFPEGRVRALGKERFLYTGSEVPPDDSQVQVTSTPLRGPDPAFGLFDGDGRVVGFPFPHHPRAIVSDWLDVTEVRAFLTDKKVPFRSADPAPEAGGGPARPDPAAEALVGRLSGPNFQDREAAAKALRTLGTKAVPALKAGLAGASPEGAERCKRVLADIRKDDLDRFLKAFAADTDRKAKFDHPVWLRWSRVVGDDRHSRELLTEVLGATGAAETLDRLEADPKAAADLYPAELDRLSALALTRMFGPDGQPRRSMSNSYSIGEAAYGVYLGSYPGATSLKSRPGPRGRPADPEMDPLESLSHLHYRRRGPWVAESADKGEYQAANLPLDGPKNRLFVAALLNLKNPRAVEHALRRDGGLRGARGDLGFCLPLVRMVCREKTFPIEVRAASWPYLAEAGEVDYLPDMAAAQADATRVQQFWRSDENMREYNVLVSDASIACQLLLHQRAPKDFGFIAKLNEGRGAVDRSCFAYGFPDDDTRKAAHAKALAFLSTAPAPKPRPAGK